MNLSKIIITAIIILLPGFLKGQQLSFESATFAADQDVVSIVGMTQDSRGLIWIASNNNGLFNYDGIRLTSFKPETNNLGNPQVSRLECVLADSKDNIWVGTFQEGLQHFDPETESFTSYTHSNSDNSTICSDSVRAILEDEDGFLWIGTVKGLDKFDINTRKFTRFTGNSEDAKLLAKEHVRTIYKDKSGILWISCGSPFFDDQDDPTMGGLYRLDKTTGEVIRYKHVENDSTSLTDNRVRTAFEDSRGVFWVGTSGDGLHIMDRGKGTFTRLHYDTKNPSKPSRPAINNTYNYVNDHITFINEDAAGFIWIGTFSGGLNRYNPNTNTVQHYGTNEPEPYKLERNDFWCSLLTRDNLFWISGWAPQNSNQILCRVSTTINQLNFNRMENWAGCFFEEENGTLWIGGLNEIVRKSSNGEFNHYPIIRQGTNNCFVISMEQDEKNNLWLSTNRGLFYFNTTTKNFREIKFYENISITERYDTVAITTLLNDNGTIWIGSTMGLILMDTKTGKVKHYKYDASDPASLGNNIVDVLYKDKEGKLWVGSNMGLNLFDPSSESFQVKIGRQANVNCMYEDRSGNVWVGTANLGLYLFNPQSQTFTQFNDSTHILINSKSIYGISEDHENSLWLNSQKGFIRLNTKTKTAELFGRSWNIQPEILANHVYTLKNGKILIGSQNGYFNFLPEELKNKAITPKPFISKLFIGGKQVVSGVDEVISEPLSATKEITLAYNQNNFALEFDCIDFMTDPIEKNQLFKLVNYDEVWRQKSGEGKTYYYNVPPGKYEFRVKAVNLYGIWGEKSLIISITPPWYKTTLAYIIFTVLLLLAVYLIHRLQRDRVIKSERKKNLEKELQQAREIEKAYTELKATQAQLIHSEKMASLGELTAGIAHEIQNPLNFVNNFSEVNNELIDELKQELNAGNIQLADDIANDIKQNEQKITYHGKRAESIVKGMLMHSRGASGKKGLTDINALAEEYLRLSYHGFRARDKNFNADFKLEADESLPKINVVQQDIGRVLLNLINNAFYAAPLPPKGGTKDVNYVHKPAVVVKTSYLSPSANGGIRKALISVSDNGPGIPSEIKDKIFQPFFTTKPTGEGTGLGLSLSYDIVKAHGGTISVHSGENNGTEFIIEIPLI